MIFWENKYKSCNRIKGIKFITNQNELKIENYKCCKRYIMKKYIIFNRF